METWADFVRFMVENPPSKAVVSTFNFYTGLLNWKGNDTLPPAYKMSSVQLFLYLLGQCKKGSTFIITPPPSSVERITKEIALISRCFFNLKFRRHDFNHSKIIGMKFGKKWRFWNGSRNFHSSETEQFREFTSEVIVDKEKVACKRLLMRLLIESKKFQ